MVLLIVGAVNWGLVGLGEFSGADWNVVDLPLGSFPAVESFVYVVVGLAGRYELYFAYHLYAARSEPRVREREPAD